MVLLCSSSYVAPLRNQQLPIPKVGYLGSKDWPCSTNQMLPEKNAAFHGDAGSLVAQSRRGCIPNPSQFRVLYSGRTYIPPLQSEYAARRARREKKPRMNRSALRERTPPMSSPKRCNKWTIARHHHLPDQPISVRLRPIRMLQRDSAAL